MHIGLDLLFLSGRAGGVETYVRELVPAMLRTSPAIRVTAFVPLGFPGAPWLDGVELVPAGLPGPHKAAVIAAQSTRLVGLSRSAKVDLLHCPANFAPRRSGVPLVVTVHDLLHRSEPQLVSPITRLGLSYLVDRPAAKRARRILTVSDASAADIVRFLGRDRRDIDVTPPAAGAVHAPTPDPRQRPERHQVLSVGNAKPHKNLEVLIRALALLPSGERPRLVLPGVGVEARYRPTVSALGLTDDVVLPGWVSDDELEHLYATSSLYVCPSRFEGFGLPVLEAMQRGLPVACSDIPVLNEVAGGAALTFDPLSERSVADAVRRVLGDSEMAAELAEHGRIRARAFTWPRTAELTLASYDRALSHTSPMPGTS